MFGRNAFSFLPGLVLETEVRACCPDLAKALEQHSVLVAVRTRTQQMLEDPADFDQLFPKVVAAVLQEYGGNGLGA